MANRRTSMRKIKDIYRLYEECKLSQRQISKALNISRPVVKNYITDFIKSGLNYMEIKNLPDDKVIDLLKTNHQNESERYKTIKKSA